MADTIELELSETGAGSAVLLVRAGVFGDWYRPLFAGLTDVPAHADLGQRVVGPAMTRFKHGDVQGAFELFMSGMCGPEHRALLESVA